MSSLARVAMMVTMVTWVACSGNSPQQAPDAPFEPTAFAVDVHGSGRPVILIPGLGCAGDVWAETVAHLAGYQTHVLTLSGFAGRAAIAGPLAATVRDELSTYIVDRKLDHPIVIGHSMGGFIAYWLASSAPDLVGPVIVVDAGPSLGTGDAAADADTGAKLRAMWTTASDDAFAQQAHDVFAGMVTDPGKLAPILAGVGRSDRAALGGAIAEMFTTDLRSGLSQIRAPLLLVLADGSLQDGYRAAVDKIPDHQIVVVPHAKHFVFVDDPPAFFAAIDAFLAAHPIKAKAAAKSLATPASVLPS